MELGMEAALECRTLLQEYFVHVAPLPALAGLEGAHDGMLGLMKMLGGVGVLGGVAAPHMSADETFTQMDPGIAHLQAFFAPFAAGGYLFYFFGVGAGCLDIGHGSPLAFVTDCGIWNLALSIQPLRFDGTNSEL
jgi:hypothetical protein